MGWDVPGARSLLIVVCLLACGALRVSGQAAPSEPSISVITFGRGDRVHQYFGHNALVVEGGGFEEPMVFNYGMFAFGPNMIPQFLKGRLRFWLGVSPLQRTVARYKAANRDVRVLDLQLTAAERAGILQKLLHDAKPENRYYLYDHYRDNCSTRVRDILDDALAGQLRRHWSKRAPFNLRQETRRYTAQDLLTQWSMMFGLNGSVDRPQTLWEDVFLPLELEALLEAETVGGAPLVTRKRTLFAAQRAPLATQPNDARAVTLAWGLGLALLPLLLGEAARRRLWGCRGLLSALGTAYGLLGGLAGTLLAYLALFSDHEVAHGNLNLLLLNPLTLLAGLASFSVLYRTSRRQLQAWRLLWMVHAATSLVLCCAALLGAEQDVSLTAGLLAPLAFGLAISSVRSGEREKI